MQPDALADLFGTSYQSRRLIFARNRSRRSIIPGIRPGSTFAVDRVFWLRRRAPELRRVHLQPHIFVAAQCESFVGQPRPAAASRAESPFRHIHDRTTGHDFLLACRSFQRERTSEVLTKSVAQSKLVPETTDTIPCKTGETFGIRAMALGSCRSDRPKLRASQRQEARRSYAPAGLDTIGINPPPSSSQTSLLSTRSESRRWLQLGKRAYPARRDPLGVPRVPARA
jgi:hypothetical protein